MALLGFMTRRASLHRSLQKAEITDRFAS